MNARLDPRIVAARTQGRALAEHGTWTGEEAITPTSQGCVMDPRLCMSQNNLSEISALSLRRTCEEMFNVQLSFVIFGCAFGAASSRIDGAKRHHR
jgi:hypothetical protein